MNNKLDVIKCPTCGAEYLPVEIFIPDEFFGRPKHIERDQSNHIIDIVGQNSNTIESYICDYCKVPFRILAKTQFVTKPELKFDFDSEYTTNLKTQSLFLDEE